MPVQEVFVDLDSVVFIQEDGPCTGYLPVDCHAIEGAEIGRSDTVRVYCKHPSIRGERAVARTIQGRKEPGTLTIIARSQRQSDLLHRLYQNNCMFGAQTHLDVCGMPSDLTAYSKILDYYGITPGNLGYSNMDNLEGGDGTPLQLSLACTFDDLIEVLKVQLTRIDQTVITDTVNMLSISGDLTQRCGTDVCGAPRDRCDIVTAYTAFLVGPLTANCWYTTDNGTTWALAAADPLATSALTNSIRASCIIEDRWLCFAMGLTAGFGGLCSYTDNSGGAWTEVDMGATAGADYVSACYVHDAGSLWACGGDATPSGHVWFSSDRGESWTLFEDVATQILNNIATADGNTVYAVGNSDMVIKTIDGGENWTVMGGPATAGTDLQCVRALTNDHVLVGGEVDGNNEQLWCSLDGGTTWTAQTFTGSATAGTTTYSMGLAPQAPMQHAWIIHGDWGTGAWDAFRSVDGGHNWERFQIDNDGFSQIFVCDTNHVWISGDTDAGQGGTATVVRVDPIGWAGA